jgi:hypothetical protein
VTSTIGFRLAGFGTRSKQRSRVYIGAVLPYSCYLRVYEPAEQLDRTSRRAATESPPAEGAERVAVTVASEQRSSLDSLVRGSAPAADGTDVTGAYVLTRDSREFLCPVDLPLRCLLSLGAQEEALGEAAMHLLMPAEVRARADEAFVTWRRDHPGTVPHIRQATWGVPRTWFLLVVEDEREQYDGGGRPGVRYRARLADARRRLTRAQATLASVIEDLDLHEELVDLQAWLDGFGEEGWLELDYAGVAGLLGPALAQDQSARDVHVALRALRKGDFAAAGLAYRRFEDRWRTVNAYERAN